MDASSCVCPRVCGSRGVMGLRCPGGFLGVVFALQAIWIGRTNCRVQKQPPRLRRQHTGRRQCPITTLKRSWPSLQAIVDVATLTGACIVALGGEIGGLFTPSDDMAATLTQASKEAGE